MLEHFPSTPLTVGPQQKPGFCELKAPVCTGAVLGCLPSEA